MAKKLTTQAKIVRLHNQGFSDSQIANVTGFSKSSVGRIRRGQQSGEKIAPAVNEFFKLGKRAKQNVTSGAVPLPSAKPVKEPKAKAAPALVITDPIDLIFENAEKSLARFADKTKVVLNVQYSR